MRRATPTRTRCQIGAVEVDEYLGDDAVARAVYEEVHARLQAFGPSSERAGRSQIAFRRARGFAYLWIPGRYVAHPDAEVVLSIALGRHDPSPRFKEVVHPATRHWMHHLELHGPEGIDDEVVGWLREAYDRAG